MTTDDLAGTFRKTRRMMYAAVVAVILLLTGSLLAAVGLVYLSAAFTILSLIVSLGNVAYYFAE